MRRRPRPTKSSDQRSSALPIFSYEDFDFGFKNSAWPIGLKSTYPEELVRRVAAAMISYHAGNSGIDYTYKRFLKNKSYKIDDGSRLDLRISKTISHRLNLLDDLIYRITALEPKRNGEVISEWTFMRVPFSIKFLISCANRGAFF